MTLTKTLRFRIVISSAALSALIVAAVSVYVIQDAQTRAVEALEERVSSLAAGVASASTDVETLSGDLPAAATELGVRVTVVDSEGLPRADSHLTQAQLRNLSSRPEIARAMIDGRATLKARDLAFNERSVISAHRIEDGGEVQGVIRISSPLSAIESGISELRRTAVIGGILVVAVATGFATILSGRLTRSIARVTAGARRVAAGQLDHRLWPERPAEVQQLANAVNEMASRLSALISQEADERTRLSSILSTMSDGVILVDAQGGVELANPAAREMLDAPSSFSPGEALFRMNHNYELNQLAQTVAETGESVHTQIELLDSRKFLQALAVPLETRDDDAQRTPRRRRALILLADLTEMRQVETTRREFVSNASHELRTPISAIRAAVETLQAGAMQDPTVASDFLRRIASDVERMDRMVSELLELSRLESGQIQLHLRPVDASELVTEVVDRLKPLAQRAGVTLVAEVQASLPLMTADGDQLEHALSNLVSNAIRSTPAGGQADVIVGQSQNRVEFRVRDTGVGIEPEHLPHIFERFYKIDRARSGEGTGLGLAITRHIVQVHDGEIYVDSQAGEGSTFTIRIPAKGPAAPS